MFQQDNPLLYQRMFTSANGDGMAADCDSSMAVNEMVWGASSICEAVFYDSLFLAQAESVPGLGGLLGSMAKNTNATLILSPRAYELTICTNICHLSTVGGFGGGGEGCSIK